jgi:hypothetical protein
VAPWVAGVLPPPMIDAGMPQPGQPDARVGGGGDNVSGGCGCRGSGASSGAPIFLALLAFRRRRSCAR